MKPEILNKIGQKLVIGFPGTTVSRELEELIYQYRFGNIILFRENLVDEGQTKQLIKDLNRIIISATGHRPLISIDQEGGSVTRLPVDSLNIPGQMALACARDLTAVEDFNYMNGRILLDFGFSLNLAPVLDINSEADNPIIGSRSFGDLPEIVELYGKAAIAGLKRSGILCSAKHFPGHGDTKVDSHLGLPVVDFPRNDLNHRELLPFKMAVREKIPAIMTTHILFPQVEEKRIPATMSRTILTDILRKEMKYEGLIISDCMEMKAIQDFYGTAYGVKEAFKAGVDLCFVSHTPSLAVESINLVYKSVLSGEICQDELTQSLNRIYQAKSKVNRFIKPIDESEKTLYSTSIEHYMPKTFVFKNASSDDTSNSLTDFPINSHTVFIGPKPFQTSNVTNINNGELSIAKRLALTFGATDMLFDGRNINDTDIQNIVKTAEEKSSVVLCLYNAYMYEGQKALWKALRKIRKPMLLVALRSPYDFMFLEKREQGICIFEYTEKAIAALISCLKGENIPSGTVPVNLPYRTL
ncbi:MAG: glycoside hydrolase family 3 protein [Prevotellaceae bacterium]|nr:glycoside hydrolase family 3 protein [Prevotellaceae bacterium]